MPLPPRIAADDVVVEDRFDRDLLGRGLLRVQPRADEPLLLRRRGT